jgi:hypothetical protein
MSSFVWKSDPQEAFEEPYEYEAQEQFYREASNLLRNLYSRLSSESHEFHRDERSAKKAIWLLQMDALDSLFDCLDALQSKRHRVAGKLFRDIEETLDLAALFSSSSQKSNALIEKWFNDEVIPNREYRDYVKKVSGDEIAGKKAKHYANLSKFTHRTYHAILDGYSLGRNNRLVHDRVALKYGTKLEPGTETFMVMPSTISAYCAVLASEILFFCEELYQRGNLPHEDVISAMNESMEEHSVPRRFIGPKVVFEINKKTLGTNENEQL